MKSSSLLNRLYSFFKKNFLLVFGFLSLTPFLIVANYNNPSYIDDYCYAGRAIFLGFWEAQKYYFHNINGRYSSTLVLSLDIVNPNNRIYFKLFPIVIMLLSITALYCLINKLFNKKKTRHKIVVALGIFIFYICSMPILSEGFFWWASTITYQLGNIFLIFFITILLSINKHANIYKTIYGTILLFFLIGFNECILVATNLLLMFIIIHQYLKQKKINFHFIFLFISSLLFSLFTILAPGNYVRIAKSDNAKNFIFSSLVSLGQLGWSLLTWSGIIILFSIVLYYFLYKDPKNENKRTFKIHYKTSAFYLATTCFSMFFLGFWAQAEPLPPRARNSVYLVFLLSGIYTTINYIHNSSFFSDFSLVKRKKLMLILTVCCISILFSKENFVETVKDVAKFKARKFNSEIQRRNNLIFEKSDQTKFDPIENKPFSIFLNGVDYENPLKGCFNEYSKNNPNIK